MDHDEAMPSDEQIEARLRSSDPAAWARLRAALSEPGDRLDFGFVQDLYRAGIVFEFDWPGWDAKSRYPDPAVLGTAPIADVARYVTSAVRADRFVEGLLDSVIASGDLARWVTLVCDWHDAIPGYPRPGPRE